MNPAERLNVIIAAIESVGLRCLVMGGHIERKIRSIAPASSLHRALVEVVRRQYKVFCQERDRVDKEAILASQQDRR